MLLFPIHFTLLLVAFGVVLFVPGIVFVNFLERKSVIFSGLERLVLSVSWSIVSIDAIFFTLDRLYIPLRATTLGVAIFLVSATFFILTKRYQRKNARANEPSTKNISLTFVILFIAIVVTKTLFFLPSVVPSATDLGHHMYWVKKIVLDQHIPDYTARDIVTVNGDSTISDPKPISDFIVGEHLVLAALQMFSGADFTSSYSSLTLFLIHLVSLLALYSLTLRIFETLPYRENIALLALLLGGFLYAFSSPQMKYVLGGVVGNTMGNLLIPTIFLLLFIALQKANAALLNTTLILTFGLAYTHHLSTLLFGVVVLCGLLSLTLLNFSLVKEKVLPLLKKKGVIATLGGCLVFFFLVWPPSYIQNNALSTVVGAPVDTDHLGYSFSQLKFAVGEPRMILGLFGLVLLLQNRLWRRSEGTALLLGWTLPLILLAMQPDLLRIDLPSARVANYLIYPLILLSAFTLVWILEQMKKQLFLAPFVRTGIFLLLLVFVLHNGLFDNTQYLDSPNESAQKMLALNHAATYLAKTVPPDEVIVHDHVNILGDSWIKLAFMRDYNFPLYRANLFRYDRISNKQERCTLYIISTPSSKDAKKCFTDLHVTTVLVNQNLDGQQFKHFNNFEAIYNDAYYGAFRSASNQETL